MKVKDVDTESGDGVPAVDVDTDDMDENDDKNDDDDDSSDGSMDDEETETVDVDSVDDKDADDTKSSGKADAFGHSGKVAPSKGAGNTNIVGAVVAVFGIFAFVAIASGIWCYCKSKEKAFVSLNVIDLEEHDEDVNDEQTVMMTVVNEGHSITVCDDEDIL